MSVFDKVKEIIVKELKVDAENPEAETVLGCEVIKVPSLNSTATVKAIAAKADASAFLAFISPNNGSRATIAYPTTIPTVGLTFRFAVNVFQ